MIDMSTYFNKGKPRFEDIEVVTKFSKKELKIGAHMLTRSFADYPMTNYLFPNAKTRPKKMRRYFYGILLFAQRYGRIIAVSPKMEGLIVFLPDTRSHFSDWDVFRSGLWLYFFRAGIGFLRRLDNQERHQYEVYKKHIRQFPHMYFMVLGVDPDHQGKGYASQLLKRMLAIVDENNLKCYLETYLSKNIQIYQKYGFEVVEETCIPRTQTTFWGMVRE